MIKKPTKKIINLLVKIFSYVIIITFTILTIAPIFWVIYTSFKTHADIIRNPLALPLNPTLINFKNAWKLGNLGIYSINSIIYTSVSVAATVFLSISAGYGLTKFKYATSKFIYTFFLLGLLISVHSVLVPLFVLEKTIGIINTRLGVIIPYIAFGLPMGIFLATSYVKGIPDSYQEAAIIDGASYFQIYRFIIIPFCLPIATTITIITFIEKWNEFIFVFLLTSSNKLKSLPVGINAFFGGMNAEYGLQAAGLVIGIVPMIMFYIVFQKQIIKGFSTSGLKE